MLIGEYQHSLDTKGRVNFPAKLREDLGDSFILSKGLGDECLFVYSNDEWEKLTKKLNARVAALLICRRHPGAAGQAGKNLDPAKPAPICGTSEGSGHRRRVQPRRDLGPGEVGNNVF